MDRSGEVLIVEADESIREFLATVVRLLPRKPVLVRNGRSALDLLGSREFEAIILEVVFTDDTALAILANLDRERPELLSRTIVTTTSPKSHWPQHAGMNRVATVLLKPFAIDELQVALSAAVLERKPGDQFETAN